MPPLLTLVWEPPAKGSPPLLFPGGSRYYKWLVHTGSQHSYENEDEKQLLPTDCWHSFWSEDDERSVLRAVGTRPGDWPRVGEDPSHGRARITSG